jgi:site-specific recombinase XerD
MTSSAPTIDDFIASKQTQGKFSAKTAAQYRSELERFRLFLNDRGATPRIICDATRIDIVHFLSLLLKTNLANRTQRKLAPPKAFFKFLRHVVYRRDDPTDSIPLPKAPRHGEALVVLTRDEVRKLLSAPDDTRGSHDKSLGPRDKAILHLYYSGLKKSEGLLLKAYDVEPDKRQVTVSGRAVPLKAEAAEAVAEYLRLRPETKERALILNRFHKRMWERKVWAVVKKVHSPMPTKR